MKNFIALVFILSLCSCGEKLLKEPDDLIAKDKMVDILSDLTLLNAAKNTNPSILREHGIDPTRFIFEKYRIDSLRFVTSDMYYASLPKEYEAMYLEVGEILSTMKDSMEEKKRKNDSLLLEIKKRDNPIKKPDTIKAKDSLP
ncbi:MAG: hypothetical protein CR994_03365 [Maribacter sp.]|nr:MAG: hypothetical protein CR994_03365 [Maribacter sp.]